MRTPSFLKSATHSTTPAVPPRQSEVSAGNAAFTFLDKKSDPERNVYATQTGRVVNEAKVAAQQSMHRHRTFMQQLKGSKAVLASDPAARLPSIDTSEIDYDVPYRAGVRALKRELKAQGMKFPSELSSLPYGAREALKNVATSAYNLQHADPDVTLKNMTYMDRKTRERFENGLAVDKRIIDYAQEKLSADVRKLRGLFVTKKGGIAADGTIQGLRSFFKQQFNVSLKNGETARFQAEFRNAETDDARQDVIAAYRNALLRKIPWGAPENGIPASRSTFEIAEAVARERAHQTALAGKLKGDEAALVINGGSLFLEKGKTGDDFTFRLRQPYGQQNYQPVSYELRFTLNRETGRHDMQLLKMSESAVSTPITLPDDPAKALEKLNCYMSKTDLSWLFTEHTALGVSGFEELYGEYKAQQLLIAEVRKTVHRPLKDALIADIGGRNITSVQMTGFSYNYGHYGENLAVNDRGVMMGLLHELAGEGRLAIIASCGGHQDLLYNVGGVHIGTIPDMLNKTYLPDSRHANDPFTVEEKQSNAAIQPNTLSAAIFEKPIGQTDDAPDHLRSATPQTPIAQQRSFPLSGPNDDARSTAAQQRAVWAPREAAPLSLPLLTETPDIDPVTHQPVLDESGTPVMIMELRPFTFHHDGRPVIASGNLRLASGVDANGNPVTLDEGRFPYAGELATWQRIELKHELPGDYCLKDDEGRNILDERGEPVRLLEKITIVPQKGSTEVYRMEKDGNGKLQPVWHDSKGNRVFPKKADHVLPTFFDAAGNPAAMPVALQRDSKPIIQFGITGIERWVRVPMSVPADKDKAKLDKHEHVLCTYEKRVLSVEDQNLDVAILQDPMYTRINCVHSQNGINTSWDQPASAVEMTGNAVKPNDEPGGRRHLLGVSLNNPAPHPIAANPHQPGESYINETAQGVLGHGTSIISHQPHSDMLKEEGGFDAKGNPVAANPYAVGRLSTEILPQYRGQRQGNAEGVQTGVTLRNLRNTLAEIRTAGNLAMQRESTDKQAMLAYLDEIERYPDRFIDEFADGLNALRDLAHPESRSLAAKLEELPRVKNLEKLLSRGARIPELNLAIEAYRTALKQALSDPSNSGSLRTSLSSHLQRIQNIGAFEEEPQTQPRIVNDPFQAWIKQLAGAVDVLSPNTMEIALSAPEDCTRALKSLQDLAFDLEVDTDLLRSLIISLVEKAKSRVRALGVTDLRPSDAIEETRLRTLQARNDFLYKHLRRNSDALLEHATPAQLAYELFAKQNYSESEMAQAIADKEALVAELEKRRNAPNPSPPEDVEFIDAVLASWKAFVTSILAPAQPQAFKPPRNAGIVAEQLATIPEEDEKLLEELSKTLHARALIRAVFDGEPIGDLEAWKTRTTHALAEAGLLDHLGDTPEARAAKFNELLSDRNTLNETAAHVDFERRRAAIESVSSQVTALNDMIKAYRKTEQDRAAAGPQLRFRALPARGWQMGTGVTATVGTSGPVNSTLNAIIEAADNVSAAASQAFSALTAADATLFSTTLFFAGMEGSKNAAYGKQRVDKTIPAYEKTKEELQVLQRSLQESIDTIRKVLGKIETEPDQEAPRLSRSSLKKISTLAGAIDARMKAVDEKLRILHQASHAHAFNLATNPLLSLAAAAGITTTALGLAGIATTAAGPVGGALLAGFGAAGAVRSTRELMKDRNITHDITKLNLGIDSGIRRRVNVALENRRNGLKWDIGAKATLATGGALAAVGTGLLATPAAPAGPVLIGVGGALIFGGAAGAYLPPRREWRGTTMLAAEDTTLLKGSFLTTNFRRNRALYHLGAKSAMVTELVNKISDRALQVNDLAEGRQFRQTFKTTRKLRWLAPDIHRKELAKVIARHPDETKDNQSIFMYYSNLHELNWLQTYVDELSGELEKVTGGLGELAKTRGIDGNASDESAAVLIDRLRGYAGSLATELNNVQKRYKACKDLHDKLEAYQTEQGREFSPETRAQFDDLRIRYLIVHDVVADTMSRKDAIAMVSAHERLPAERPRMLRARIGDQIYDGARIPEPNPTGKVSNVEFIYSDETVTFLRQQFQEGRGNGLENSWAAMVAGNLSDKWNYEMSGILHLAIETSRAQAKEQTTPVRKQATAGDSNPPETAGAPRTKVAPAKKDKDKDKGILVTTHQVQHSDAGGIRPEEGTLQRTPSMESTRTGGSEAERRKQQSAEMAARNRGQANPPPMTLG